MAGLSTNGSGPPRLRPRLPASRRVRLAVGAAAALVIAAVLVAPVVLLGTGGGRTGTCTRTLTYAGTRYVAHPAPPVVQAVAIGVGVLSGCGAAPANADLRTLEGIRTGIALGVASEGLTVYVREGVCTRVPTARLLACLSRAG